MSNHEMDDSIRSTVRERSIMRCIADAWTMPTTSVRSVAVADAPGSAELRRRILTDPHVATASNSLVRVATERRIPMFSNHEESNLQGPVAGMLQSAFRLAFSNCGDGVRGIPLNATWKFPRLVTMAHWGHDRMPLGGPFTAIAADVWESVTISANIVLHALHIPGVISTIVRGDTSVSLIAFPSDEAKNITYGSIARAAIATLGSTKISSFARWAGAPEQYGGAIRAIGERLQMYGASADSDISSKLDSATGILKDVAYLIIRADTLVPVAQEVASW